MQSGHNRVEVRTLPGLPRETVKVFFITPRGDWILVICGSSTTGRDIAREKGCLARYLVEDLYWKHSSKNLSMASPILSQEPGVEEGVILNFEVCDDRAPLDQVLDPHDHEDGFSPSNFHPDQFHESGRLRRRT